MAKELRVGIIGCGGIANAKHMPGLAKLPQVEMTAFANRGLDKARMAANTFGSKDAKVYADYREMLEDDTIDVVHVCTSNNSHADIAIAALAAGKHVMCEKPMAITTADARRMVDAAKHSNKKLTISYNNRYRPDTQYLYRMCRNGDLGHLYLAKAHALRRRGVPTWGAFLDKEKQGGGPLIDIGTHSLDMALWLMDNYKPKAVLGTAFHQLGKIENAANPYGSWDPKQFTVEDSAFAMITMENGASVMLEASWALNILQEGTAKVTLCGTAGGADMWDGLTVNGEKYGNLYTNRIQLELTGIPFYETRKESPSELEARLWIEAILNDTEPVVKPEQALIVQEILEAIYVSSETGKAVYF
ncbi:Gfo/Idh/MocA family protein [Paenibacillus radicis (ex Xue et al. 2023)]|uniref:Gfo/Idh/MocA family oxidoreductase n=1 Tax=Paenibacillus radicis (ex Xue et al. 2023) TaxID=2972489 RepID=A0ABT1YIJ5_9BACL|nr:Gfo/Idh/MocA family oxidoreductase [Paenibacillus radicis (ex Xue et al. 2023)]MCR8632992.1 Gfo/Idh/MocA family oxidoreductase [Paenibacillus radicis (ex Xue et al. 2023)]